MLKKLDRTFQERIKKFKRKFNNSCSDCIAYSFCRRNWLNNLKIPKENIIKVKGKRPQGRKVKYSDLK